ncbi:MAG TPA: hypothetical protein VNE62_03065 [Actinomycetota bacterium]|nr:hypothetical protein [Actinomycetota bacterium]
MRKPVLVSLLVLALLMSACGKGDDGRKDGGGPAASGASETAGPDETEAADETAPAATAGKAGGTAAPARTGAKSGSAGQGAPVPAAPANGVNRPRIGSYVYALSGFAQDPLSTQPKEYPAGSEATIELSANGNEYTGRQTTSQGGGSGTQVFRWEATSVLLSLIRFEGQGQRLECALNPPAPILRIPLRKEAYPAHTATGENCRFTFNISVVGQEDVADSSGKTWKTWRLEQKTDYQMGGVTGTIRGPVWFSPDLGTSVKEDQTNDATFSDAGQSLVLKSRDVLLLKRHP